VLTKLLSTPTPTSALVAGKAFGASVRSLAQAAVVVALSLVLRVGLTWNPLNYLVAVVAVVLGAAFFSTLSTWRCCWPPRWPA
jgi:ABC-2 type transport system permease protein